RRKNMRAEDREKQIVAEAVRFFAECGFEGQTRELAKRMGVSHAVIYRHFDSKEALIERVYEHVYLSRWNPDWEVLILDRSRPLKERMVQFYQEYAERVFDYDWVRIFMYSGLKSFDLSGRYLTIIREKVVQPFATEFRAHIDPDHSPDLPGEEELELFWGLHGSIFYMAIRQFVYNVPVDVDVERAVRNSVEVFYHGAEQAYRSDFLSWRDAAGGAATGKADHK
ncbi:TetR/AcrR family transcriptional regulator, partial [Candidatus Halocynthiibacter alkanivorans]|uniref:TetR/AcrR family transcriptional regulator n=1 Tax=Candidatus Halocynthiibacter alkanivorans TaxID=2267619 RepID=UPI00190F5FB6